MSRRHSERIAALNDAMRRAGPLADGDSQWKLTIALVGYGSSFQMDAIRAVMRFDSFTPDNDPYGEHDFGSFDLDGERLFWKIDYYDLNLEYGSPDPADPAVTRRVLTIMFASDY